MNVSNSQLRGLICGGIVLLILCDQPSGAALKFFGNTLQVVDGVNAFGNPSTALGKKGPGKIYKDVSSGVIVQTSQAMVMNLYGYSKSFKNRGLTMYDPQTFKKLTSTSDLTTITPRITGIQGVLGETGWGAAETKTYTP